jgi:hypothetical protein
MPIRHTDDLIGDLAADLKSRSAVSNPTLSARDQASLKVNITSSSADVVPPADA